MSYDKNKIKFKTYAFSYGTTSFRVSQLKYKIERQLIRLKELREIYPNENWQDLQLIYFDMLVEEGLVNPSSTKKDKDARQKTSPLVDFGFIDENRELTQIGKKLYEINYYKNYKFDNLFFLRDDAYLYFIQLLKLTFDKHKRYYDEFDINPFLALIYLLINFEYVSKEIFIYAFAICKNFDDIQNLKLFLEQNKTFEVYSYLQDTVLQEENYQEALKYFLNNMKTIDTFNIILMDRKSKKNSKIFLELYTELITFNTSKNKFENLKNIINKFESSKLKPEFRKRLKLNNFSEFKKLSFQFTDEELFYFFHTSKVKVNLEDYYDLNKRFIELSEVIIFEDEKIYLDELVYLYFRDNFDYFSFNLKFDREYLFGKVKQKYNISNKNLKLEIKKIKQNQRKKLFDKLIEKEFSNNQIIKLLQDIKQRKDKSVLQYTSWDCNIPTIFEYLVSIIFYKITKSINLNFLNMSLNASLLPIRFASGNQADIIYSLKDEDLIVEVTLSTDENQRRMELEPVIRHLGKYQLQNKKAFAIFIAPYLDPNVLVMFRAYKDLKFYDTKDYSNYINGLEILPISIDELICLLNNNIDLKELKQIKNELLQDKQIDGLQWYNQKVKKAFLCK